jgi:hypothetical protein
MWVSKQSLSWLVELSVVEPAQVQVQDLAWVFAFAWIYSKITQRYSFSARWRARQQQGTRGDFVNLRYAGSVLQRCL